MAKKASSRSALSVLALLLVSLLTMVSPAFASNPNPSPNAPPTATAKVF